jgi:hypothetical protein
MVVAVEAAWERKRLMVLLQLYNVVRLPFPTVSRWRTTALGGF